MNNATLIFLVNDKTRACLGTYESDEEYKGNGAQSPRSLFKTLDPDIAVGDLVIVPTNTRHNFTVMKVTDVDVDVDIEHGQPVWIAGRFDPDDHKKLLRDEQKFAPTRIIRRQN